MFDDLPPPGEPNSELPPLPDWMTDAGLPDLPALPDDLFPESSAEAEVSPSEVNSVTTAVAPAPVAVSHDPLPAVTPPPRSFSAAPAISQSTPVADVGDLKLHVPARVQLVANDKVAVQATIEPPDGDSWSDVRVVFHVPRDLRSAEVTHKPKISRGRIEWTLGELHSGSPVKLYVRLPNHPATLAYLEAPPTFEVTYVSVAKPDLAVILSGPTRVRIGSEFAVEVAVDNQGAGSAREVSLAVIRGDRPSEQTNYAVGDLCGGEQATATLRWSAPATDGPAHWSVRTATGTITTTHTYSVDVYTPVGVSVVAPNTIDLDSAGSFGVTVSNPSARSTRAITVSLLIPPQLQFESSDGHQSASDRVVWAISDLAPGESRTVTAWLRGHLPGTLSVSAEATTDDETISAVATCTCELPRRESSSSLASALVEFESGVSDEYEVRATATASIGERHLLFRMGENTYACPLVQLREVIRPPSITPIPDAPEWLLGLANVRGDVTSIVDLALALGLESAVRGQRSVLMAETDDGQTAVGLLVDEVIGIRRMTVTDWTPDESLEWGRVGEFLSGLSEQADKLIPVLDLDRALTSELLDVFASA